MERRQFPFVRVSKQISKNFVFAAEGSYSCRRTKPICGHLLGISKQNTALLLPRSMAETPCRGKARSFVAAVMFCCKPFSSSSSNTNKTSFLWQEIQYFTVESKLLTAVLWCTSWNSDGSCGEISSSHSDDCEDDFLLDCCAVLYGRSLPKF